jgi:predicted SprT family Zn-dependent metalloprotease
MRRETTVGAMLGDLAAQCIDVSAARTAVWQAQLADLPVVWNPRLRTRAGLCVILRRFAGDSLSRAIRLELNPRLHSEGTRALADTFLHELAHALLPTEGHSRKWQLLLEAIGGNGTRCHSYASMRQSLKTVARCERCQHELKKTRRLTDKKVERMELGLISHRGCGGKFRPAGE